MAFFDFLKSWRNKEYEEDGFIPLYSSMYGAKPEFNQFASDLEKLAMVFQSPAALKVFKLQCDLYSLGRFIVTKDIVTTNEKRERLKDPVLKLLKNPNPYQTGKQLLWDQMFFNMLGTSYTYVDSKVVDTQNKIYVLMNSKIWFPESLRKVADKMIFSEAKRKEIYDTIINYRYDDGSMYQFPLNKLIINTDLSNGTGNFFKGNSTIDALYKVICNSEAALDSANINLRYAGKFMVAGTADPNNVAVAQMGEPEKQSIEKKMNGKRTVHAFKSMLEIKRFVENYAQLELNTAYLDAYYIIGNMYGIPRDVLEAYNSSTFENQEKARASHVSYSLAPKGEDFAMGLTQMFGYDLQNKEIGLSWDHLPFVQVFELDRAKVADMKAQLYLDLLNNGVSVEEANTWAGTTFTTGEKIVRNKVTQNGN